VIEHIVPPAVHTRAAYGDELDHTPIHPEEEAAVERAVPKRRHEFSAGRACARAALAQLGHGPVAILRDTRYGAPVWPDGVVGSITHCQGYRAAAVAHAGDILGLGIDAEPHEPLPDGVIGVIHSTDRERAALAALREAHPGTHWDRLLFSAKETFYKTLYPYHRRMLGFEEAELLFAAPDPATPHQGTYTARLLVPGPLLAEGVGPDVFSGRWITRDGLAVTAITVPNDS
jgi:4'-phosphopantetheinyl transferase EntD